MRIRSNDIPQADDLDDVIRAVAAVNDGAETSFDIADVLGKVARQGRYYRRAAEILGLVRNTSGQNRAIVTNAGRQIIASSRVEREKLVAEAVLRSRIIERIIPFLESKGGQGATRREFEHFIEAVTEHVGESMIHRRASTILSWLRGLGILREASGRLSLSNSLPVGVPIVEYEAEDEPLFPEKYELKTYQEVANRAKKAGGYLSVLINEAARDRADQAHQTLTNLVARKIRAAGAIPKQNRYVDLSTVWNDSLYLFEMKSTTDANVHSQIRSAISQLYEYRYLQEAPSAKLVVVIENPLPDQKKWLADYVVRDRELMIAWDGDQRTISFPPHLRQHLEFLASSEQKLD